MRRAGRSYSPSPCEQRAITWARIAHCFRAIIAEFFDSGHACRVEGNPPRGCAFVIWHLAAQRIRAATIAAGENGHAKLEAFLLIERGGRVAMLLAYRRIIRADWIGWRKHGDSCLPLTRASDRRWLCERTRRFSPAIFAVKTVTAHAPSAWRRLSTPSVGPPC